MKKGRLLIILFFSTSLFFLILTGCKKTTKAVENQSGPPPAPNVAHGVKIKKNLGNVRIEIDAGTASPNKIFQPTNIFQSMLEKRYKIKLTNLKINISADDKFLNIKAGAALSNEEFTRFRIRGIMNMEQKGLNVKKDARNIDLSIRNGKIIIESVM